MKQERNVMAKSIPVDSEQFLADLAWDFCQRSRKAERVDMEDYLQQCPNHEMRAAFKKLVNADLLMSEARQAKKSKRRPQLV